MCDYLNNPLISLEIIYMYCLFLCCYLYSQAELRHHCIYTSYNTDKLHPLLQGSYRLRFLSWKLLTEANTLTYVGNDFKGVLQSQGSRDLPEEQVLDNQYCKHWSYFFCINRLSIIDLIDTAQMCSGVQLFASELSFPLKINK